MDTNTQGLCIKTVLTHDKDDQPGPILLGFTAYWGPSVTYKGNVTPNIIVSSFKLQLTHDHPIRQYFDGKTNSELASCMQLLINGEETKDDERV